MPSRCKEGGAGPTPPDGDLGDHRRGREHGRVGRVEPSLRRIPPPGLSGTGPDARGLASPRSCRGGAAGGPGREAPIHSVCCRHVGRNAARHVCCSAWCWWRRGLGVTGAMLAGTLAAIVTLGIVAWPLRREFHSSQRSAGPLLAMGDGLAALLALGGFWVFASTDTFLVRHLMAPHPAGLYAAAVTGSRIALFAPAAFVTLVFPRFAATHGRGPEARRLLVLSMGVVVVIGFAVAGVIAGPAGAVGPRPLRQRIQRFGRDDRHPCRRGVRPRGHRTARLLPPRPWLTLRPVELVRRRRGDRRDRPVPPEPRGRRSRDAGHQPPRPRPLHRRGLPARTKPPTVRRPTKATGECPSRTPTDSASSSPSSTRVLGSAPI